MSMISNRFSRFFMSSCFAALLLMASVGAFAAPIDINTADANTLASTLTGIGAAKAEAIVAYREANGPFKKLGELVKVKGVGEKTVEKNRAILVIHEVE